MTPTTLPPPSSTHDTALSTGVVEAVRALIETAAMVDPPLRCWEAALDCGHVVEYRRHATLRAPEMPELAWRRLHEPGDDWPGPAGA